ncbi:hypothetical protein ABZ778_31485 [Streptomyces bacillaris]|uniref:hypothetical protein n=1 Tax=Streptomyces bacillaris TaxID=68179 RepID=UPI003460957C
MSGPSEEYLRGWRDGYAQGRDDEAEGVELRDGPPAGRREQDTPPYDRQVTEPRRNR